MITRGGHLASLTSMKKSSFHLRWLLDPLATIALRRRGLWSQSLPRVYRLRPTSEFRSRRQNCRSIHREGCVTRLLVPKVSAVLTFDLSVFRLRRPTYRAQIAIVFTASRSLVSVAAEGVSVATRVRIPN